jgi:hypothetical protein
MDDETVHKLSNIFEPYWIDRRESIVNSKGRFVHYTSADSAIKIIQTKSIWMRNARCMNDYNEISHGYTLLGKLFREQGTRKTFVDTIDGFKKGTVEEVFKNFDAWWAATWGRC